MPKFKVVTVSQENPDMRREVTLTADSEREAKNRVRALENRYVNFSLLPDSPVEPTKPDTDEPEAWSIYEQRHAAYTSEVESYPERWEQANDFLEGLKSRAEVTHNGRIYGLHGRERGQFQLHHQTAPYKIKSVEAVRLGEAHVGRLVSELSNLHDDGEAWDQLLNELRKAGIPMAAVTGFLFGVPVKNQWDGTAVTDFDTDTIKTSLHTSTYTPSQDTHDFFNDITNEITGTGYTAGGVTLGSKTVTYDTASDQIRMDAADAQWTTSTLTARYGCVYKSTGTASTSPVLGLVDFGADVSTTAGTFQITWDATGVLVYDVT